MKLSKTIIIVIAAGVFVIIAAFLGMGISKQSDERARLEKQLAAAQTRLKAINPEPLSLQSADTETQLNEVKPQLESVKARLSDPISSAAAASAVYEAARAYGIAVSELASTSPATEDVAGVGLTAISLTARVYGDTPDVVDFVKALRDLLKTGAVKSVEMTIPEIASADNVTWISSDPGVAAIDSTGLATAISTGNTTITAISGAFSSNATLTVVSVPPVPPATANISPLPQLLNPGQAQRFSLKIDNATAVVPASATTNNEFRTMAKIELTIYTYKDN